MQLPKFWNGRFRRNMGQQERYVRMLVGVLLLATVVLVPTAWGWVGLYPLLTGFAGSSPVYRWLGIDRYSNIGA